MKTFTLLGLLGLMCVGPQAMAQKEDPLPFRVELQTDLVAYTTLAGYSAWVVMNAGRRKVALAFVNYPNRQRRLYEETGIREDDRFVRLQVGRYFKPTSKLKNFYHGTNAEFHWRELVEDGNSTEVLNDTYWVFGQYIGYDWHLFPLQENALRNLRLSPWLGFNLNLHSTEQARVFENTASVYPLPMLIQPTVGINLSYTLFAKP